MKTTSSIAFPAQKLPVLAHADVVVAGAGASGVAAAIQAARLGRSVVLLDRNSCAGGILSAGLLPSVIHMGDGRNLLASGLCQEMCLAIADRMHRPFNRNWFNVHPEAVKIVLDEMLERAGVRFFCETTLCAAVTRRGRITAVAVMTRQGMMAVTGKLFIDATGDGTLSMLAGAPFSYGSEEHEVQGPTLCSYFTDIDFDAVPEAMRERGLGRAEWQKAVQSGEPLPVQEGHFVGLFRNGPSSGSGNLGHIYGTDVLDPASLAKAYREGRRQAWGFRDFFRSHVAGFAKAELGATASLLGVRESRRVVGDYVLTREDYLARRHFRDDIGCFAYGIDIHSGKNDPAGQAEVEIRLGQSYYKPGENYGIPYRALLVAKTVNLLVAGRCISADRAMQASIRIVPGCMITGQAAGAAAALALEQGRPLRRLAVGKLQTALRECGCFLGETR